MTVKTSITLKEVFEHYMMACNMFIGLGRWKEAIAPTFFVIMAQSDEIKFMYLLELCLQFSIETFLLFCHLLERSLLKLESNNKKVAATAEKTA